MKGEESAIVARIHAGFIARRQAGDNADFQSLLRSNPEHADELKGFHWRWVRERVRLGMTLDEADEAVLAELPSGDGTIAVSPGVVVGDFKIFAKLGQGGMGQVWEAEQQPSGRRVALKLLALDAPARPDQIERFRREGQVAASITHPNCVFVFVADEFVGVPYIAMELMPGGTLSDVVRDSGALSPTDAVDKILQVVAGLQAADEVGVIHRDVKPSNCFVGSDGTIKVGDFGLSKTLEGDVDLTKSGTILGTPAYASPEQLRGRKLDARSDQYSLGATLYFLLTGRPPFQSAHAGDLLAAIVSQPPPSVRKLQPRTPRGLQRVLERLLAKEAAQRYDDWESVRAALTPFATPALAPASLGERALALFLDALLIAHVGIAAQRWGLVPSISLLDWALLAFCWFAIPELWGKASVGKLLVGIRVTDSVGRRAGWRRLLVRNTLFVSWIYGPMALLASTGIDHLWMMFAPLLTAVSMRRRNGLATALDLVSHTRMCRLLRPAVHTFEQQLAQVKTRTRATARESTHVGPFAIAERPSDLTDGMVVHGSDAHLERPVLLHFSVDSTTRRPDIDRGSRPTRIRWLQEGHFARLNWDAFEHPSGLRLSELQSPVPWERARHYLHSLSSELAQSCEAGSLPSSLSAADVWLRRNGSVCLAPVGGERSLAPPSPTGGACNFISKTAGRLIASSPGEGLTLPIPVHAQSLMRTLAEPGGTGETLGQATSQLEESCRRPASISIGRRIATLLLPALLVAGFFFDNGWWLISDSTLAETIDDETVTAAALGVCFIHTEVNWVSKDSAWQQRLRRAAVAVAAPLALGDLDFTKNPFGNYEVPIYQGGGGPTFSVILGTDVIERLLAYARVEEHTVDVPDLDSSRAWLTAGVVTASIDTALMGWTLWLSVTATLAIMCAAALRNSVSLLLAGICVRLPTGAPAGRWRCMARSLLVWGPAVAAAWGSRWLLPTHDQLALTIDMSAPDALEQVASATHLGLLSLGWLVFGSLYTLLNPSRGLQERATGTLLLPK